MANVDRLTCLRVRYQALAGVRMLKIEHACQRLSSAGQRGC